MEKHSMCDVWTNFDGKGDEDREWKGNLRVQYNVPMEPCPAPKFDPDRIQEVKNNASLCGQCIQDITIHICAW